MIPDIYHGDPVTDFDAFLDDVGSDFCILKATQGTGFTDDCYAGWAAECHVRSVPHWAYSFFVASDDATDQAQHLIDVADDPVGLILDVEDYNGTLASADMVETAARYIVSKGYKCMVYFMDSEGDQFGYIASLDDISSMTASWVARYGTNDGTDNREPDHGCSLHQYTSAGSISGIDGAVDLSHITGTGFDLAWFRGEDDTPTPVPTPTTVKEYDDMNCIISDIMGTGVCAYFDGHDLHDLTDPDDITVLDTIYQATHGGDHIPIIGIDGTDAPWSARLHQVITAGDPLPLVPGLDGFAPRCPR